MKQLLLIAGILLCSFQEKEKDDPVKVIEIIKTTMRREYFVSLSCDDVGKQHPRDTFHIYDKEQQKKILEWIGEASPCNDREDCDIDSRARMSISYESGRTDILCIGYESVFSFNGKCMELPRRDLIKWLAAMDTE